MGNEFQTGIISGVVIYFTKSMEDIATAEV